jgi:hypothetical protein
MIKGWDVSAGGDFNFSYVLDALQAGTEQTIALP